MSYQLKMCHGALDDLNGSVVLRGVVDPGSFGNIKVGEYQRGEARSAHITKLVKALHAGARFPDIEIGSRGGSFRERDGCFYLDNDCYVVDGLQRLTAAKRFLAEKPNTPLHIGALVHFNTEEKWERERFKTLNLDRSKVSPNVLLRNEVDSPSIQALRAMTASDNAFMLRGRVCWTQRMARDDLLSAMSVVKVIGVLHNHFGPGLSTRLDELVGSVDKTYEIIGQNIWRANVRSFFDVVDQAFGLRVVTYRDLSPQLKIGFLSTLARVFADHSSFWEGKRLKVEKYEIEKLHLFPLRDPGILALTSSGSKANPMLYARMIQHLNSNRRTRRLVKWNGQVADGMLDVGLEGPDDGNSD